MPGEAGPGPTDLPGRPAAPSLRSPGRRSAHGADRRDPGPDRHAANRADIRDFLTSRRARITPEEVGLPTIGPRRVPGLRREEVAQLASISTDYYTRVEQGRMQASLPVLEAIARALQLDEDERRYLFDLARAAGTTRRAPHCRRDVEVPPSVQWMLDSMTKSSAFVRNGRMEVIAHNALFRALHAPMFDSDTIDRRGRPNIARYLFLDPGSADLFVDWQAAAVTTVALMRAEAGREPRDWALRELIGELSTLSTQFRSQWAAHHVRIRHYGIKRLQHPDVGRLELAYRSMDLPLSDRAVYDLTVYTAEPGTRSEDRLKLLASWAATRPSATEPPDPTSSSTASLLEPDRHFRGTAPT
ncbi:helix-turn-helix domain-containing protein [Streptomyces sp. NBC_00140]|uniref:helix-turn-helix domain-containing protein n=1 Tax=Streptomyces sp. NBC_00140 TaxID=2975664 RepID=UPI00225383A1|nr:helix-turn-helix domain-containing protein [Streptomyces sp. NBC_00140]MCX5328757.1 helix-turn-helix domain-containing protein [Streptomyces sp. NBC_00140]